MQKINELIHEKCDSFCSDNEGHFVFSFKEIEFMELVDVLAQLHQPEMPEDEELTNELFKSLNETEMQSESFCDGNFTWDDCKQIVKWFKSQIK